MIARFASRRTMLTAGVLLLAPAAVLDAQEPGAVSVVVTLGDAGSRVPGVRVRIPGLQREGVTDSEGALRFSAIPAGDHQILADMVGCQSGAWTVQVRAGHTALHLRLDGPAVALWREMVAAGSASAASEAELPFTVHRLERSDVDHTSAWTLADLIRGRFPGIKVVQGSGQPGQRISIQFRGPGSIAGRRAPLVVVDGIITEGGLDDMDPLDVERMEMLKGPAGAAVYGARGEAGVIEITTRRGAPATAPRCFFSSKVT